MGIEQIARQYIDSWNRRDFATVESLLAADAASIDFDGTTVHGPAAARAQGEMWATAFPDGQLEVKSLVAAGDTVVMELHGRGTNDGPFGDLPATHRAAEMPFCQILRIAEGKIVYDRQYGDTAGLFAQLGVTPELATA